MKEQAFGRAQATDRRKKVVSTDRALTPHLCSSECAWGGKHVQKSKQGPLNMDSKVAKRMRRSIAHKRLPHKGAAFFTAVWAPKAAVIVQGASKVDMSLAKVESARVQIDVLAKDWRRIAGEKHPHAYFVSP